MTYKLTEEETYLLISKADSGIKLASIENEIGEFTSFIIDANDEPLCPEQVLAFKGLGSLAAQKKGLLIVVSKTDIRETIAAWGNEKAIWLPTVHEAKEAIFMNDLENQFMAEM